MPLYCRPALHRCFATAPLYRHCTAVLPHRTAHSLYFTLGSTVAIWNLFWVAWVIARLPWGISAAGEPLTIFCNFAAKVGFVGCLCLMSLKQWAFGSFELLLDAALCMLCVSLLLCRVCGFPGCSLWLWDCA